MKEMKKCPSEQHQTHNRKLEIDEREREDHHLHHRRRWKSRENFPPRCELKKCLLTSLLRLEANNVPRSSSSSSFLQLLSYDIDYAVSSIALTPC